MKVKDIPEGRHSTLMTIIKAKNDPNYQVLAGSVMFINRGTTRVILENHIALDTNEHIKFEDFEGGYIVHNFSIDFVEIANPPEPDGKRIANGNCLIIVLLRRKIPT